MLNLFKVFVCLLTLVSIPAIAVEPPSLLCIKSSNDQSCTSSTSGKAVKWHPGHYVMADRTSIKKKVGNYPNIKGAKIRYFWRDLEPKKGKYDFSEIEKDLAAFSKINKRLFIYIEYKAFNKQAQNKRCAPEYIKKMGGIGFVYYDDLKRSAHKGHKIWKCIAQIYKKPVADRVVALIHALGNRFNNEPYIEGLLLPETAGSGGDGSNNSIANNYRAALKRINTEAKKAFPNSLVFVQTNYLPGGDSAMKNIMDHALKSGIGVGGPDLFTPNRESSATKLYNQYAGKMPLSISNERATKVAGDSPSKAFKYAVTDKNGLHVNYLFWATHNPPPWDFDKNIVPMLKKNNWKINKACPANIKCNTN